MGVYFIQCEDNGPIKIGVSVQPADRLVSIQITCPFELSMLAQVDEWTGTEEAYLHRAFRNDRLRGEWFSPSNRLLELIRQINAGGADGGGGPVAELRMDITHRPRFAVALYAAGYTFRRIGAALGISHETARYIVDREGRTAWDEREAPKDGVTADMALADIRHKFMKGEAK